MRKYSPNLFFLLLFIFLNAQAQNKTAGICFRVDDNHPIKNWDDYNNIFNKYGYNFCFALNPAGVNNNPEYIALIKKLQNSGNELLDHTPDHRINYFTSSAANDFVNIIGVDHVNGNKVCLKYYVNNSYLIKTSGNLNLSGEFAVSNFPGEFKNLDLSKVYAIYVPVLKKAFNIKSIKNFNSNDPDSLYLQSFWNEKINLSNMFGEAYYLQGIYDLGIRMSSEALTLLFKRSKDIFSSMNVKLPTGWIQSGTVNGDGYPSLHAAELINHGFVSAAVYPNASYKCYNEYDKIGVKKLSLQWGDFMEDANSFYSVKKIIADRSARHFYSIGHSHFSNLLGGWNGYLARMDSLLNWCKQKNLPVVTYSEMAKKLYIDKPNPYENVFPLLQNDLDEDGFPDGFYYKYGHTDGTFDRRDGVKESGGNSFIINKKGSIVFISSLGGLEKGENEFSIYTKGAKGNTIDVTFSFPEYSNLASQTFRLPAENNNWTKYSVSQSLNSTKQLIIPDSVSIANIQISCSTFNGGEVKISGMTLRKKTLSPVLPPWNLTAEMKNDKSILLNWKDNSSDEAGFIIYRKQKSESDYMAIDSVEQNISSFEDNTISENSLYQYKVNAYSKTEQSEFSNFVEIKSPKLINSFYEFNKGWNLFSVPTKLSSMNYPSIFSTSASLFTYFNDTGYNKQFIIEPGKGYWINIGSPFVQNTIGSRIDIKTISLKKGWNLIGVYDSTISANNISTSPPGIIQSNIFTYSNGYIIADSLKPTKGYWLNCSSDGVLNLNSYVLDQANTFSTKINGSIGTLSVTDANNSKGTLFLTDNNENNSKFELPPVPPESAFDTRWSTNKFAEYYKTTSNTVNISNAKYPITIVVENIFMSIRDGNGRKFTKNILGKKETFQINDSLITKLFIDNASIVNVAEKNVPTSYQLIQNFPNPFNPSTEIKYSIPYPSSVKVQIFNLIGQLVDELVNTIQDTGYYRLIWKPHNLSSGVYFCVLEAHSEVSQQQYRDVKKVMYLK